MQRHRYGKCSSALYGYALIAWNGNGSTYWLKAVLASASFAHPSTSSRKSRFHPAGNTGRRSAGNSNVSSSPEPMMTMSVIN